VNEHDSYEGAVLDEFHPEITDVLPSGVARIMVSMLREVINSGTAVRAKSLAAKYPLAGKTGTTNDFTDAWFMGFSPNLTCGVWVGFDDPRRTLGEKEEGAKVALPIWMEFMSEALKGSQPVGGFPESPLLTKPEQVKQILASTSTGFLADRKTAASASLTSAHAPHESSTQPKRVQQTDPKPKSDATSLETPRSELVRAHQID